ncbi:glycosyltransferase family 4 protein [Rhodoplanes roseus]|uniref:Glycosyl transferase n=1 Tax=Rhodoplanes roseus TaxID=29409 RepID=A0A327KXS3_9BRAD|nr:glycosyltransferase family 4 protein [Rhodoplanes roseus]RAI43639.1 glycosyl transferase [Rhodoplanes roseus]
MRIAQIAPLTEAIPPKLYGGTERVVSWLTEELVALGHDVTLFASGDSVTGATLRSVWPRALRLDPSVRDAGALHALMLETVRREAHRFDILHFHLDYFPFSLFSRQSTPFVTTLHGRLDLIEQQPLFDAFSTVPVVSISDAQRRPLPQANYVRTIHHGLPHDLLAPGSQPPRYLAALGRISPEKGFDRAIRIAAQCGLPLKIAAKIDRVDRDYFDSEIAPLLELPHVEFIGEIRDDQKAEFLGGALALLLPVDWPEPFGLVMIEAMACGTPVVAYDRGSIPEVVEDGRTGFVVADEAAAVEAVRRVPQLSRAAIRERFCERFSARRMAEDYVAVYRELIAASADGVLPAAAVPTLAPV